MSFTSNKQFPLRNGARGNQNHKTKQKDNKMIIEVGVVAKPSHAEQLEGKPERLVLPMTQVVAETDQAAILRAGVENADKLKKEELSRATVVIRRVG